MTTLECVPTPILPFLEQAMKQHLLPARSKEILFELIPSLEVTRNVTVNVDPFKMITVFRNILSNAIKFTKLQGRVTIRVEIKRSPLDNIEMMEVSVKDSGAGLSPANLLLLFGEGVQFNANGLQGGGGSGLGLFITKGPSFYTTSLSRILFVYLTHFFIRLFITIPPYRTIGFVLLHKNAKIWAESEGEGKGCTFFVCVPIHSHQVLDSTQSFGSPVRNLSLANPVHLSVRDMSMYHTPKSLPSLVPVVAVWKPTILVVDDSPMNRKVVTCLPYPDLSYHPYSHTSYTKYSIQQMLVRSLVSRGFACCEAEDGVEALSVLVRSSFASLSASINVSLKQRPIPRIPSVAAGAASMAGGGGGGGGSFRIPRNGSCRKPSSHGFQNLEFREKQMQHYSIDAVLIDFNMPRMNGPDTIVQMRTIGFRGPIIGVSGGDDKQLKQFLDAGADNVIQKPAKTDTLVAILLTGLEMVVVFDETQQRMPTPISSINYLNLDIDRDKEREIKMVRQVHMEHLLNFLSEIKTKAKAQEALLLTPSP